MATDELRELRHKYKAAYTSYIRCVQELSAASQHGVWPLPQIVKLERDAFADFVARRMELLNALFAHSLRSDRRSAAS